MLSPSAHYSLLMVYKGGLQRGPSEAAAQRRQLKVATAFPTCESCTQGPSLGAGFLQRQSEWVRGGPRSFVQWEFAFLRRVRPSHARAPGGRSAHASWAPHPEAVRPGPFRQLAGHRSQKGLRKKHKTRGLSCSVLLLSSSETGQKSLSLVLFPEAKQA